VNAVGHAVARLARPKFDSLTVLGPRGLATYALELIVVGALYFVLARLGAALAPLHPSLISPVAGLALAAVLLRGLRVWPAILVAALAAGILADPVGETLTSSVLISAAMAAASTIEALVGGFVINVWSDGRRTFDTPAGVAKFALVNLGLSAMIGAAIGVGSLCLHGSVDWANAAAPWAMWWLRDAAGALVITPVIVLWAIADARSFGLDKMFDTSIAVVMAVAVGLVAFSPLIGQTSSRSALAFLAALPLAWSALRCGPRDAATAVLILSCFAVWGVVSGGGPFVGLAGSESILLPIMFMISASVAGLAWSADVAVRQSVESRLRLQ
jgi:integral membrane sensor domain MASE1